MRISKIVTTVILGMCLSVPLMAGDVLSQELVKTAKKWTKKITPQELKKKIDKEDDVWMLDIRESYMVPEGSIEGMENIYIGRGVLEFNISEKIKDKDAFIVVYCRSGKGAALAAETLKEKMKYTNVYYLEGGVEGWLEAGYSIFNAFGELKLVKE